MSKQPEEQARERIDAELRKRGWKHLDKNETGTGYKEEVRDSKNRPADYVLYINGDAYAIIEAKREEKLTETHLQQARNYAKHFDTGRTYGHQYGVPFIFSSNGEDIYIDDLRDGTPNSREILTFYSPKDIKRKLRNNAPKAIKWLQENNYTEVDENLWENQQNGLEAIKKAIYEEKNKMLVSMATGSGKTRLSMALVYQLLESDYANKVLFVPDTKQLERDGKASFENYNPPGKERFSNNYIVQDFNEYKEKKDGDVVVSTIQKLKVEVTENNTDYSSGEFDIIIADECHRGLYNKDGYAFALNFFDGIEIGLTATPHQQTLDRYINHVYEFDYQNALDKDLVVPFTPHRIQTEITMQGIHRNGIHYSPKQIGRDIIVTDTHRVVADGLLEHIDLKDELTLVFAQNIKHAEQIAKDFKDRFKETVGLEQADEFIKVISSEHQHSEETLEQFKKPRRNPKIAVTVNMVSTGVDIKPLNNLVFLRAIKSKILYNQMMGRGTRKYEGKNRFRVFDCVGLLDYHDETPPFNTTTVQYTSPKNPTGEDLSEPKDDPRVISERGIDSLISNNELYPVPGDFVNKDAYLNYIRKTVYDKEEEIRKAMDECTTVQEASEKIEEILKNEFEFYREAYILRANGNERVTNLFEFTHSLLLMTPSVEEKASLGEEQINKKYNLTEEQIEWVSKMASRASVENDTITKEKLLNPPFSGMGGYDAAKNVFDEEPTLDDVINVFNSYILSLKEA